MINEFKKKREKLYGEKRLQAEKTRDAFLDKNYVKGVHDEHLVHREVYNPNKFDVYFFRSLEMDEYVKKAKVPLGEQVIRCKAGEHCYLPHGYFIGHGKGLPEGTPINVIVNFGDSMFTGNTKVSLPAI